MRFKLLPVVLLIIISSCSMKEENERLTSENAELQAKLEENQKLVVTMEEIGVLLDSIDQSRDLLKLDLETGTSYQDFTQRVEDIYEYVKNTEVRIDELERSLADAASSSNVYASSVQRLKKELKEQSDELAELRQMVDDYAEENEALLNLIDLQDAEIEDKEIELEARKEELAYMEQRIEELVVVSQMTKADAYFARAQAVEEAARRTKLAPKKKKKTLEEALYLYRQALDLGKSEAEEKVKELQEKI